MQLVKNTTDFQFHNTCVTIGKFNGLHRGHQLLVEELKKHETEGLTSVMLAFDMSGFRPGPAEQDIYSEEERLRFLKQNGPQVYISYPFTAKTAAMEPEEFVEKILIGQLGARVIVVGDDFRFGRNRAGDAELLKTLERKYNFKTTVIKRIGLNGEIISSSAIRGHMTQGDSKVAEDMLNRSYWSEKCGKEQAEQKDSPVKAVIFDLDGTLIDTEKIYRVIWPKAMKQLGYEFGDERYLELRSLGRPYAPRKFKEWYGEDFDYDGARRVRKVLFDEYLRENGIERKPGAAELVEYLRGKGITTAICSATDPERCAQYMEMTGLDGLFDKVISATMVDEGKPSPKVYLYACEQLGLKPSECIAVEDAPNGIRSAAAAGMRVIMVPDQSEPDKELTELLWAKVCRLDEIMSLI